MSSSLSATEQHEQQIATPTNESSVPVSQQFIDNSVISSPTVPVLPGQILTQSDHEDNLIDNINEIIRNFLIRRFNRQQPYHAVLRWTTNDVSNLNYSVVLAINQPEDL